VPRVCVLGGMEKLTIFLLASICLCFSCNCTHEAESNIPISNIPISKLDCDMHIELDSGVTHV